MGKAQSWGEKGGLEFSLYFQSAGEKGNKMEISMDKLTFSGVNLELFEQFHVITGVSKAKHILNSIWICIQETGKN